MSTREYALRLRFTGRDADDGWLEAYDGATSIQGFTQALQLALHAYMTGEIVSRATALKGAAVYIKAPRSGSFLLQMVAFIEAYPATLSLAAPVFYDFMKFVFSRASGLLKAEPESDQVKKLLEREEPFFDALTEQMEGSLQRGHRPIGTTATTVTLERPQSVLVTFDAKSKDWVSTRDENPKLETFHGNVTRYNSVTRNGRAYIDEVKKIVPFRPDDAFSKTKDRNLTWSLHGGATQVDNRLTFTGKRIESAHGEVKRILLTDCEAQPKK